MTERHVLPRRLAPLRRPAVALAVLMLLATAGGQASARTPSPLAPAAATAAAAAPKAGQALVPVREVEGIQEYRLPNGLQVLLVPDAAKPTTTVALTLRVGSRHENYGETGMAHLLEHLIFKGTPTWPNVWKEFEARGFQANGTTWLDRTNYFASFARNTENTDWMIGWLADAMVNSFIAKKDLDSEMTVVRNEMERTENDPSRILYQRTIHAMYDWHNYGKDTIGARADVESVDISRLQAFYRTWYQPDNATLVVSGAFDVAAAKRRIEATFGAIPKPQRELPRLYTLEARQDGERRVLLQRKGGTPLGIAAYHGVAGLSNEQAAAELLTLVLGDTPSGRLHRRLTEQGLAASTSGWTPTLHDPGFLMFDFALGPQHDAAKARAAFIAALDSVHSEPITEAEVRRARSKWLKAWDQGFNDPERIGVALSDAIGQGDWRNYFLLRDRVEKVTAADVNRFARERLVAANRTVAWYEPTETPQRAPQPAAVDVAAALKDFTPRTAAAATEAFDTRPMALEARTLRSQEGGIRYAILPKPSRGDVVELRVALGVGDAQSLRGQRSPAVLMAALLGTAAQGLSREQLQDELDERRSQWSFGWSGNQLVARVETRAAQVDAMVALLGRALRQPSFEAAHLAEAQAQVAAALTRSRAEPEGQVRNALARHGMPYDRADFRYVGSFDEQLADVQAVTPAQLQAFHQRFLGAGAVDVAAVGPVDPARLKSAFGKALGGWASPVAYTRLPTPAYAGAPTRMVLATPDKQNAYLRVLQRWPVSDRDADYVPLMLGNAILGNGGSSRLWARIREKDGLSYSVGSFASFNPWEPSSQFGADAIFAPQNAAKVEAAFQQEVARLLKDGITPEELADAKRQLLGERALNRAQDAVLADALLAQGPLQRRFDLSAQVDAAIEKATVAEVNAALRRHLKPEDFVIGVGGDLKP